MYEDLPAALLDTGQRAGTTSNAAHFDMLLSFWLHGLTEACLCDLQQSQPLLQAVQQRILHEGLARAQGLWRSHHSQHAPQGAAAACPSMQPRAGSFDPLCRLGRQQPEGAELYAGECVACVGLADSDAEA